MTDFDLRKRNILLPDFSEKCFLIAAGEKKRENCTRQHSIQEATDPDSMIFVVITFPGNKHPDIIFLRPHQCFDKIIAVRAAPVIRRGEKWSYDYIYR